MTEDKDDRIDHDEQAPDDADKINVPTRSTSDEDLLKKRIEEIRKRDPFIYR